MSRLTRLLLRVCALGPNADQRPDRGPSTGAAARDVQTVRLDYDKSPIWLCATSGMERSLRTRSCAKEPWTVKWLEERVRPGDVLYDIGANVGVFSLVAAKNDATVVAFEPGYASFAHLCENIVLNGCEQRIIPVPLPLSSSNGLVGFTYRTREPGQSRHKLSDAPWQPARRKEGARYQQPVLAVKLEELVRLFNLPHPNHIKLDVDGWELHVLAGATGVLEYPELRTILVEIDQTLEQPVAKLLAAKNFSREARHQRKPQSPCYALFCRRPPE